MLASVLLLALPLVGGARTSQLPKRLKVTPAPYSNHSLFYPIHTSNYSLSANFTGDAFFEGFDFFTGPDPTNGHVDFVSPETANATGLAGLIYGDNATGAVYLGVDSTNVAPSGRPAIRAMSNQTWNHALVIADILHMPGGICGTWPAFWLLGLSSPWPAAGEIDILEGVNNATSNQMTLHTNAGVVISNSTGGNMTGIVNTTNCDTNAPNQAHNAGCAVLDQPQTPAFGTPFNQNGGGVYAMEYTSEAIKIWFFDRTHIPSDISSGNPEPNSWPTPNALFAGNSSVDLDAHFCELQIIFDTTFCGDWAGAVWAQSECVQLADTCEAFVSNNPSAFKDAYWAINGVYVYENGL